MLHIDLSNILPLIPRGSYYLESNDYKLSNIKLRGGVTNLPNGDYVKVSLRNTRGKPTDNPSQVTVVYVVIQSRRKELSDRVFAYSTSIIDVIYRYYIGSTIYKPIITSKFDRLFKDNNPDNIKKENMGIYARIYERTKTSIISTPIPISSVADVIYVRRKNARSEALRNQPDHEFYDTRFNERTLQSYEDFLKGKIVTNVKDIRLVKDIHLPRPSAKLKIKGTRRSIDFSKEKEYRTPKYNDYAKKLEKEGIAKPTYSRRKLSDTPKVIVELPEDIVSRTTDTKKEEKRKKILRQVKSIKAKRLLYQLKSVVQGDNFRTYEEEAYLRYSPSDLLILQIQDGNREFFNFLKYCIDYNLDLKKTKELAIGKYSNWEYWVFMLANDLQYYLERDKAIENNPNYGSKEFERDYEIVRNVYSMDYLAEQQYGSTLVSKVRSRSRFKLANRIWALFEINRNRYLKYVAITERRNRR